MSDNKQMTWVSASQKPPKREGSDWSDTMIVRYYYAAGGAVDVTMGWYNHKDGRWYLYGVPDGITVMDWAYMEACGRRKDERKIRND